MSNEKDELAALKKKVEELEAKVSPPKSNFVPMTDAEHRDMVHQMRERQANTWMPPSAIREMAEHPCNQVMPGVIQDRHAPNSPGMVPSSQRVSNAQPAERGTGWIDPRPLGPPPGIQHVDAQLIADEVRQRAELKRKLGEKG
jgi:hypothetical protein